MTEAVANRALKRVGVGPATAEMVEELRVLVVAGVAAGALVAGAGSRLAMLALRVTSQDEVRGRISDDGFVIGRVTLGGTYNLLSIGAVVGIIGAAAYQWVRPWLIGPRWLRTFTLAAASGAVVGAMLIHADGLDFTALEPTWLAIALFIVLPAVFAMAVGEAVDRVEGPASWTRQGRRRWVLPVGLLVVFPAAVIVALLAFPVVAAWEVIRDTRPVRRAGASRGVGVAVRAGWLAVAVSGLWAVGTDIADVVAAK